MPGRCRFVDAAYAAPGLALPPGFTALSRGAASMRDASCAQTSARRSVLGDQPAEPTGVKGMPVRSAARGGCSPVRGPGLSPPPGRCCCAWSDYSSLSSPCARILPVCEAKNSPQKEDPWRIVAAGRGPEVANANRFTKCSSPRGYRSIRLEVDSCIGRAVRPAAREGGGAGQRLSGMIAVHDPKNAEQGDQQ